MAYIVIENGALQGQKYEVDGDLVIGRHSSCTVVLRSPGISRRHCKISRTNGKYMIEDLNSRNGSYINGQPVKNNKLANNDLINLSNYIVRFLAPEQKEAVKQSVVFEDDEAKKYSKAMSMDSPFSTDLASAIGPGSVGDIGISLAAPGDETDQLVNDLQKRIDNLYQVTYALSSTTDEDELFDTILECLLTVFPQAHRALLLTGDKIDTVEVKIVRYRDPKKKQGAIKVSKSIVQDVLNRREALLVSDTAADEQFGTAVSIIAQNICSIIVAPLISQGEIYGILQVENINIINPFTAKDLNDLVGVAVQSALFMRNSKLARDVLLEGNRRAQLQRFFSPAVANEVMNGKVQLGGELKTGCTMFCDIVGFTARSEKNSAEEIIKQLNQYFGIMVGIILAEKGTIDKFGGDAIMAIWGAPIAVENDTGHSLSCSLQMQNAIVRFNRELEEQGSDPVEMGIGIHAGEFVAGNIGSQDRMEYTVIGDDVNIAARIESKALGNMVMGSESLVTKNSKLRILGSAFNPIPLKGKAEPLPIFSIRGMKTGEGYLVSIPAYINDQFGKITFCTTDTKKFKFVGSGHLEMGEASLKLDTIEMVDEKLYPIELTANSEGIFYDFEFKEMPPYLEKMLKIGIIETGEDISWNR